MIGKLIEIFWLIMKIFAKSDSQKKNESLADLEKALRDKDVDKEAEWLGKHL